MELLSAGPHTKVESSTKPTTTNVRTDIDNTERGLPLLFISLAYNPTIEI
ncbi:hypothetical protein GWO43_04530 [candidate division KSB1 bacterium]|nr:hypothetical protein [candidate division KSB1 bacterium]NIT70164.1 hypothetical protein [candidate division KSB1 bacterium]NIX69845.1 hypothetical protein [candidate division KSB1 bacterium]